MGRVQHEVRKSGRSAGASRVSKAAMRRVVVTLVVTIVASSTTFNAITVALPKLFAERLSDLTTSPALIGLIAAGTYVFGAPARYVIGRLLDRHSLEAVFLPLSVLLAPLLFAAAHLGSLPLIVVSVGIITGIFGRVTIDDAMIGKYTSDEWRARAYAARYFIGFTAAGASVALVAWLHSKGGVTLTLQAFGTLCVLVTVGAMIFPSEKQVEESVLQAVE